ncbi:MAG: hypothetical protein E7665_10705 [Ruminococcaceae bacterium]|nr:hypothetical protein [Oscillospiraceae bacterium]
MEEKKRWWQEQPLTISAVQCNLGDDDEWVLDEYVSKYGFSTEQNLHLVAKGHMGYYNEAEHGKKLDSYLKKSRKHGIREIIYNNTHCVGEALSKEHPDWLQLTKEGKTMPAYGIYNIVCANVNGAFHKNFIKELEMLCTHDIDGVFLDGPLMHERGCYCEVCKADFEKRFGHSIYEATRLELQTMRIESATGHIREAYETIKRINPDIALYINNSALRADVTGSNTRKIYDYVDILGAEGGFHKAQIDPVGLWHVSSHAKHLEGISGDRLKGEKPLVCFFAGNESGIAYYLHSPAETVLSYAQSYANGSNIWYGVHFSPSEFKDKEAVLKAKEMNDFILSNKDAFSASKTCARVALMWSQNTANNYASSIGDSDFVAARKAGYPERGDHRGALLAFFNVLERSHIQFDIIDEVSITDGRIFDYDSVILPEVACLGDEQARIIKEYVKGGGNILGNFDVAMYNEDGSFAGGSKLADVFGFTSNDPARVRSDIGTSFMFKQHDHELLEGLTMDRIPAPLLNAKMSFSDDVEILMRNTDPIPSTYASIPTENRYPSVTCHKYGKGKAYYISGNIGETTLARNIRDHARIMRNFCEITARPVVVSDASGLYEVVLRRQEERYILHVINLTGAMARPIESIVPLYNVPFELYLEGFGVEKEKFSLRSLRGAKAENIAGDGSKLSFTLDKIGDYEVVVIE